nr:MAG: RNA dependent RNA polymerase [Leviviridae sp.]
MSVNSDSTTVREDLVASHALAAAFRLWESLDSPVSLSCWLLAKYGEWDQLADHSIDKLAYLDAEAFFKDYQSVSLLSKAEFLQTTHDRREAAKRTFLATEAQCRLTNQRLEAYSESRLMPINREVHAVLHRARELILRIIGERPRGSPRYRFGPGATSLVSRWVNVAEKYRRRVDVTPGLFPFLLDVVGPQWLSNLDEVALKACNKVSFVSKNAKTFRTIAIEPHINGYAQLGIGGLLRDCLREFGIDLDRQSDVNRALASVAHALGLATIDLKNASNSVVRVLIWLLLPEGWCQVLDSCRSHYGDLDGLEFEYEMFSSMGNGFTFELETLLFYALARASGGSQTLTAVFGDDIILEADKAELLIDALNFVGFEVNKEKTYLSGPFYESCGEDYWGGVLVRPVFWKDCDVPTWFKVVNDLRTLQHRYESLEDLTTARKIKQSWLTASRRVPGCFAFRVPSGYGSFGIEDGVEFISKVNLPDCDERDPRGPVYHQSWGGYYFYGTLFEPFPVPCCYSMRAYLHCLDGGGYEGVGKTTFRGIGKWKKGLIYHPGG